MSVLNQLVNRFSRSGWLFLLCMVVAFGSLSFVFFPINYAFAELTGGLEPFDFQNELTADQIFEQLPAYTEASRQLYIAFAFVDFFFPFFASLFLAALACFSLRYLSPRGYDWLNVRNLFALFFLACAFDWAENCFALTVILSWPEVMTTAASLLVLAKQGKLACVMLFQVITWTLVALAMGKWLGTRIGMIKEST